ncbi:hypothetical protein SAMN04487886_12782 [Clostridium sp. DSM 8431]|uniref:filamentation induced by cAMP protein fic n=1 Tax=Clostridium sp. DSM 8431 TaxID=1761781 RepID=UPI0008E93845|nr:filamentation induced by cAMP protein fic [Clostridium sp. DSM 8431]SFU89033.1 hypothetical protein SAMN04487886_12782 [Clostridium sp. DSM 8431]
MFIRTKSYNDIHPTTDIKKLIILAKRMLPDYVFNMSYLENNPYTFPEVQTLMEGITIGGHKLTDQQQVLNIKESWLYLFNLIYNQQFELSKNTFNNIHSIVAHNEVLIVGCFRTGNVAISGSDYSPPKADELDELFDTQLEIIKSRCNTSIELALELFLFGSLNLFFFNRNKITSLLISNGILISSGQGVLNIKSKDRLEFNTLMLEFYNDKNHNADNICDFLYRKCISQL